MCKFYVELVRGDSTMTYVCSRGYDFASYRISCPAQTGGGVLPILADGRQASFGVAISAVNRIGNHPYEGLGRFEIVEAGVRITLLVAVDHGELQEQASIDGGSTYATQRPPARS